MTDPRNQAQRTAAEDEQRIRDIVAREIRSTFKNGQPAGAYTGYLWDGMKIVGAASGAFAIDAICNAGGSVQTVLGDTTPYRVNFGSVVYDPRSQVTTGASWAFTARVAGTYFLLTDVALNIASVDWLTGDRADLSIQGAWSEDIATWLGIGITAEPAPLVLRGMRGFPLNAGDAIYIQAQQDCGTNRTITSALSSIIIGHV